MVVDNSLRERFLRAQETSLRLRETSNEAEAVDFGGGGGGPGDMDGITERVARIEVKLEAVVSRLGTVESRIDRFEARMDARLDALEARFRVNEQTLAAVNAKLDLLTGQVIAKLPSWWQMPAVMAGTVTLFAALWAAAKWLGTRGIL